MNKQSILVMHGTFMDGSSWFLPKVNGLYDFADDEKPLPLMLLDMGYDVWVGNMRGTQWSRGHTTLDYKDWDSGYWDFTFAEKGMLDVPATIKKIQEVSGSGKVGYMGYSQGSTMMFYALTKETEENFFAENMSAFIALAPCMIPPEQPPQEGVDPYEYYIATDWKVQQLQILPNVFGDNWANDDYCFASTD